MQYDDQPSNPDKFDYIQDEQPLQIQIEPKNKGADNLDEIIAAVTPVIFLAAATSVFMWSTFFSVNNDLVKYFISTTLGASAMSSHNTRKF